MDTAENEALRYCVQPRTVNYGFLLGTNATEVKTSMESLGASADAGSLRPPELAAELI
jgi:hypothetical protein